MPDDSPQSQWRIFLRNALQTRLDIPAFTSFLPLLLQRAPLSSSAICAIFLAPPAQSTPDSIDPRVLRYLPVLLTEGLVGAGAILTALRRVSSLGNGDEGIANDDATEADGTQKVTKDAETELRWRDSCIAEESIFYRIAKHVSSGLAPVDVREADHILTVAMAWMEAVTRGLSQAAGNELLTMAGAATVRSATRMRKVDEASAVAMALGTLVISLVENPVVLRFLHGKKLASTEACKALHRAMGNFVPFLTQTSPQIAARLQDFQSQTLLGLLPIDPKASAADKEMEDIMDESMGPNLQNMLIDELPVVNSRAGLYIWLSSLMVSRPLIDDQLILGYLHNRYQGDLQTTTIDLILASFDALANATESRNENTQTTTLLKSFLINKIPLLLVSLAQSYFPPLTSEYCITEALNHVDTNAFPTLSSMFDDHNNTSSNIFSDSVRTDFCFACCLHGLIPEPSIETLLGDMPMQSLPASGKYIKSTLVQNCLNDSSRIAGLIDELENMDGNVGAAAMAIVEVIRRLCASKETMSLKNVCTHLSRKPSSLDVLLLFEKPATILRPVCDLLDTWHYEEDQGEYQPVYEEFGSILMLVMSFTRRYDLTSTDLGLETPDSFIARFLARGDQSQANETLTAKEQGHLDGWIRGLFDNESSGLGDELMSSCPPQNFYLLVPTLFNNIVLACHTNHLTDEALKGGLEFLVDIFLLPSLVSAISWLSSHLRELRGDANSVLIILGFLITKPPTGLNHSSEASQLLTLILNIVSRPLEHSLRFLQRNDPVRQDIEPLLRALKGSVNFERHGAAGLAELERWSKTEGGGITTSVKLTMASLVQWTLNPGMNIMPASYSHRQILTALKMVGARRVLLSIINEVKSQTESGHGSVGLDIAVAIICAPNVTNFVEDQKLFSVSTAHSLHLLDSVSSNTRASARRLTLREALKLEAESVHKILPGDPAQAETIVRLWRRVEAQMAPPPPMQIDMTLQTSGLMNNTVDEAAVLHSALDVTGPLAAALTVDVGAGLVGMNDGLTEELMTGLMSATSAAAGTTDLLLGDLGF